MLIDTHCHLDMYKNPEKNIRDSQKEGIFVIGMTLKPSHFKMVLPFLHEYRNVRFALGMHPLFTHEHSSMELELFKEYINKTSYIGEIGLDFSKEGIKTKEVQISCFQKILEILHNKNKFISIHSRKAEKETLLMLKENNIKNAVFHWYTGPKKLIKEIIHNGYYFSVNLSMIKSKNGRSLIEEIPIERILTETDGPYQKYNGSTISPYNVGLLYKELEKIFEISHEDLEKNIKRNILEIVSDKVE